MKKILRQRLPFLSPNKSVGQKGEHRFLPLHCKTEREQQKCACEEMTSATKEFDRKPTKNIAHLALKFEMYKASIHGLILIFYNYSFTRIEYQMHWGKKKNFFFPRGHGNESCNLIGS